MLPRKQRDHRSRRDAGALWPWRVFRNEVRMRAQEVLRHSLVFPAQDRAGTVEQHAAGADIFRLLRKNGALQGGQLRRGLVIADIRLFRITPSPEHGTSASTTSIAPRHAGTGCEASCR